MIRVTTCDRCEGRGKTSEKPCKNCEGIGLEERKTRIQIKVPPGIEDRTQLILRGQGEDGPYGGPPGDLYVLVTVSVHPLLIRKGRDLIYETEINFPQAALGAEIKVPTLKGEKSLKIPSGTQSGKIIRIRGEGMPSRFGKGDQLVHVRVIIPKKLSKRQRDLIRELSKEFEDKTKKRGWWK
jgi:molecular chaperone DnaJ